MGRAHVTQLYQVKVKYSYGSIVAEMRLRTMKDTIRVHGSLRKTLSGKQHPNLQGHTNICRG